MALFDRYSKTMGWPAMRGQELMKSGDWTPRVDISETDAAIEIKAEIPEVSKDDVKVTVENGVLTLQGERRQEKEERGRKFHRLERSYGTFLRSFALPDNVDEAAIKASFKDGMLNLVVPKTTSSKPKAIAVPVD